MAEAPINLSVSFRSRSEAEGYLFYIPKEKERVPWLDKSIRPSCPPLTPQTLVSNVAEGEKLLAKTQALLEEEEKTQKCTLRMRWIALPVKWLEIARDLSR